MRPGRFDRKLTLDLPRRAAREQILKVHARNVRLPPGLALDALAAATVGFSGADLRNLINEGAMFAARERRERVTQPALEAARDERSTVTRRQLLDRITVMLGGRAADELVFDGQTSGADQDLKEATRLARLMVTQFGMSKRLGPASFRCGEQHVFFGQEMAAQRRDFSEHTAQVIDEEVQSIVNAAETRALHCLRSHRAEHRALAQELLRRKTLENTEVERILSDKAAARWPVDWMGAPCSAVSCRLVAEAAHGAGLAWGSGMDVRRFCRTSTGAFPVLLLMLCAPLRCRPQANPPVAQAAAANAKSAEGHSAPDRNPPDLPPEQWAGAQG
jgi:ATP-dependent Zn protease